LSQCDWEWEWEWESETGGNGNEGPKGIPCGRAEPTTKCLQDVSSSSTLLELQLPVSPFGQASQPSQSSQLVVQLAGVEIFSTHTERQMDGHSSWGMGRKRGIKASCSNA